MPAREDREVKLSGRVRAFGVRTGNKIVGLVRIHKTASKILTHEKYNVITVQDQYYLALVGCWLASKFKLGLEIQNHGWEKCTGLRKLIAKFVLLRAHAVRTVSQRLKKQLTQEFRVREEKILK